MTLTVRDEADLIDEHLRYHLETGVDFVIATDHRSVDGTTEVLREYERQGHLHLMRELGDAYRQSTWVTRMARLAATDYGADWVINSDADEFWWPHQASLREILESVPARFGAVRGIWRHFALRPETDLPLFERMTVRRMPSLDLADPYCANAKVIHRADPHVTVASGNHDVQGQSVQLLREWIPFEILHFPIRTREQLERKFRVAKSSISKDDFKFVPKHVIDLEARVRASPDATYLALLVDNARLNRGLASGDLSVDVRLRDRLRTGGKLPTPSLEEDLSFTREVDAMLSLDAAHRLAERIALLDNRLSDVEARRFQRVFGRTSSGGELPDNPSW